MGSGAVAELAGGTTASVSDPGTTADEIILASELSALVYGDEVTPDGPCRYDLAVAALGSTVLDNGDLGLAETAGTGFTECGLCQGTPVYMPARPGPWTKPGPSRCWATVRPCATSSSSGSAATTCRIADFELSSDVIGLEGFGITPIQGVRSARQPGDDAVFDLGDGDVLTLTDTRLPDLRPDDFLLV